MRQRRDSKEAEKGRCGLEGSRLRKERTEEHVWGRPKYHTTNMQSELHGRAKTRRHGNPCDTESRVTLSRSTARTVRIGAGPRGS
jgi:hypothetical protein